MPSAGCVGAGVMLTAAGRSAAARPLLRAPPSALTMRAESAAPKNRIGTSPSEDALVYEETDDAYYVGIGRDSSDEVMYIHSGECAGGGWGLRGRTE